MAEQTPPDDVAQPDADAAGAAQAEEDEERAPDESGLVGRIGVEDEILAELARAEAEMNDPSLAGQSDDSGAQV